MIDAPAGYDEDAGLGFGLESMLDGMSRLVDGITAKQS